MHKLKFIEFKKFEELSYQGKSFMEKFTLILIHVIDNKSSVLKL